MHTCFAQTPANMLLADTWWFQSDSWGTESCAGWRCKNEDLLRMCQMYHKTTAQICSVSSPPLCSMSSVIPIFGYVILNSQLHILGAALFKSVLLLGHQNSSCINQERGSLCQVLSPIFFWGVSCMHGVVANYLSTYLTALQLGYVTDCLWFNDVATSDYDFGSVEHGHIHCCYTRTKSQSSVMYSAYEYLIQWSLYS